MPRPTLPAEFASRDPAIHSGDLVFTGTRVPVATFVEYVLDGATVEEFLAGYPTVGRWQVAALLAYLSSVA